MNYIEHGYDILLEISKISSISSRSAGSFTSTDNQTRNYGFAVKFRSENITEVIGDDGFTKEINTIIEVQIPCSNEAETRLVDEKLRTIRRNGEVFQLPIDIPRADRGLITVKSSLTGQDFLKLFSEQKIKKAS